MTAVERDFIALLRYGAGLSEECPLSDSPDWEELYKLAEAHAVLGLVAPPDSFPEEKRNITYQQQLFDDSLEIIRRNKQVNEVLAQVVAYLRKNNIESLLQKGQGVAQCYPNPMLRMSGDIDLLVREEDFERARALLRDKVVEADNTTYYRDSHATYYVNSVEVELHASEFDKLHDGTFEKYTILLQQMWTQGGFRSFRCEGTEILLAPQMFDVFYIFLHMLKHYYTNGVGMRQVLDFCVALRSVSDTRPLRQMVERFGLLREWEAFSRVWEHPQLLSIILRQGNMGKGKRLRLSSRYLQRLWQIVPENFQTSLRYWPFSRRRFFRSLLQENHKSLRYFWRHRILKDLQ